MTQDIINAEIIIQESVQTLYEALIKELSQDWKNYTINIDGKVYDLNSSSDEETVSEVVKMVLKDAMIAKVESIDCDEDFYPHSYAFNVINRILSGARKEDHQFERIKTEIVTNLDENGNPITAKALNQDSIYVQWQDENRFKFEENK